MKEMAVTLRRHRTLLLNWFSANGEISSGSVERVDNKAKLALKNLAVSNRIKRLKSPFLTRSVKLPEPNQTHRFN